MRLHKLAVKGGSIGTGARYVNTFTMETSLDGIMYTLYKENNVTKVLPGAILHFITYNQFRNGVQWGVLFTSTV